MGLNIKNREAHRLAEELAKLTGESMATAVTIAVRERLDRVRQEHSPSLADRLLAIGRTARLISKNRSGPSITPNYFMTNADCPNDCRYIRGHCHPSR